MIKHLTPPEIASKVFTLSQQYPHCVASDANAYDGSQRQLHNYFEKLLVQTSTGPRTAAFWEQLMSFDTLIQGQGFSMVVP